MRKLIKKPTWPTVALCLIVAASAFVLTGFVTRRVANVPRGGGRDNAMLQARMIYDQLHDANWDPAAVNPTLLRLPEQDYKSSALERAPYTDSFAIRFHDAIPQYDELALLSSTFVNTTLTDDPSASEGRRATTTGYFIVGFKDGHVVTVDVTDARLFEYKPGKWVPVFPGMDEYDPGLRKYPGT
ncbi:MAG TPA: hypothetical protein VNI20_06980 [Fimbriimonadaceae bacterium]|nr:hypothetical protein [Fimbriimonadaceae bacterium]